MNTIWFILSLLTKLNVEVDNVVNVMFIKLRCDLFEGCITIFYAIYHASSWDMTKFSQLHNYNKYYLVT